MRNTRSNRIVLALASGLLLACSWPTYGMPLFLFLAFVPLLVAETQLREAQRKWTGLHVFGLAYLSFFIWNLSTTYWLWYADPFGACFAIFVNSILMACVFRVYHGVAKRSSQIRSFVFLVALWLSFEKLHLGWEFSWPWLNLGHAFSEHPQWIQWYEYTGSFGGSLWVWLVNGIVFTGLLKAKASQSRRVLKNTLGIMGTAILLPIGLSLGIKYQYTMPSATAEVLILQPNIDPYSEKYNTSNSKISQQLIGLASPKLTDSTAFIIAPETVFAEGLQLPLFSYSGLKTQWDLFLANYPNLSLIAGISFYDAFTEASRVRSETNRHPNGFWYDDYNSAILLNGGLDYQRYDKSKLVVGVENFPYQDVLKPLIGEVMIDLGGTVAMKTTQNHRAVFRGKDPKHLAAPIICYESVYGEFVTGYVRNGASFLAIITNDAWWDETQGHKQHLSYARLRAIETRRGIARSANTGISAILDPLGEITTHLDYHTEGALKGKVVLNESLTFYAIAGDYIARISMFVALLVFLIAYFRKPRR